MVNETYEVTRYTGNHSVAPIQPSGNYRTHNDINAIPAAKQNQTNSGTLQSTTLTGLMSGMPWMQGSNPQHGWRGDGKLGILAKSAHVSWQKGTHTITHSLPGDDDSDGNPTVGGTFTKTIHYQTANARHTQVRLQSSKPVIADAGASRTFLLLKTITTLPESPNDPPPQVQTLGTITLKIPKNGTLSTTSTRSSPALDTYIKNQNNMAYIELRPTEFTLNQNISLSLLPVELVVPEIDSEGFETENLIAAQELKVGKMEHSLDGSHNINIEDDPDRFYIRIPETAGLENVSVKIATVENPDGGAYNDNETEVTLHAKNGWLESKSQLLVSDDVDDDHTGTDVGADDAPEDRTHRVQLGGKVKIASIKVNGTAHQMDWKVQVKFKKTVRLHVVRMSDAGVADQGVLDDIKLAKERYAQIGVQLVVESNEVKPVPTAEMSESSILLRIIGGGLSPAAKSLITNYGTPSFEDIHVFYCKETHDFGTPIAGFALTEASYPETPQFLNNVFVSAGRKPFTLAHELGHILTNRGHAGEDYSVGVHQHQRDHNLMAPTSPTNTIGATKRLHQKQQNWIWQHRCAQ